MTPVPDLIAQWRAKTLSGAGLMRGLVTWDPWEVPISEAAVAAALAENTLPPLQLNTTRDGKARLLLFSSPAAADVYRKANRTAADQHFITLPGRSIFAVPMTGVDQVWIDPLTPYDIYYGAEHFGRLAAYTRALAVEEALAGLRHSNAVAGALHLVRDHESYVVPVVEDKGGRRLLLAPDDQGRALGAIFTADDTFEAFRPSAEAQAAGAELTPMQASGRALFGMLAGMRLDGFVFNCAGPTTPVAFAQAMAQVVLDG